LPLPVLGNALGGVVGRGVFIGAGVGVASIGVAAHILVLPGAVATIFNLTIAIRPVPDFGVVDSANTYNFPYSNFL
jgi:hypothetical protein